MVFILLYYKYFYNLFNGCHLMAVRKVSYIWCSEPYVMTFAIDFCAIHSSPFVTIQL